MVDARNTAGIGLIPEGISVAPNRARPGDLVLINGPIAAHGLAIMSMREELEFESAIASDSAPLHDLVTSTLDAAGARVHVLRDPTRGGVASELNEIVQAAGVGIRLDEGRIPVDDEVRGACEILGFDPRESLSLFRTLPFDCRVLEHAPPFSVQMHRVVNHQDERHEEGQAHQ
jgi:hydrogenase expression/formation protein HypE